MKLFSIWKKQNSCLYNIYSLSFVDDVDITLRINVFDDWLEALLCHLHLTSNLMTGCSHMVTEHLTNSLYISQLHDNVRSLCEWSPTPLSNIVNTFLPLPPLLASLSDGSGKIVLSCDVSIPFQLSLLENGYNVMELYLSLNTCRGWCLIKR